ncbi:MAG: ABC transporter substrate-binding protein [Deltaproteobacteria bacterium]|nr:ABC transporter substrate-binding protein [Deltaproteobacteria bacterium]
MHRIIAGFVLLLCLGIPSLHAEPLKVGFIVPLTASSSLMGESLVGVVKLAELQNVSVQFEDDRCEGKNALSAYFKLRSQGVHVFYLACSGSILAVAPHAKQNGDLILTTYAGSSRIRETGDEVIRLNPDAVSVAEGLVPLLAPNMLPTVVLYEEQEYADSLARRLAELLGTKMAEMISYRPDASSFSAEILKIKQKKPKSIVLIPVSDSAARVIFRQLAQHGIEVPIIGEVNFCDYPFKPSEHGLHGRCVSAKFQGQAYDDFLSRYASIVGHAPAYPFYDAMALDLLLELDRAAVQDASVAKIKSTLLAGFQGKFARYQLSPSGEAQNAGEYLAKVEF